jgi:hypothetical protein
LAWAVVAASISAAGAAVTVSTINYRGWTGAYQLSNGKVDLVFVPQVGRIMRFGYVGDRNMLWENEALIGTVPGPGDKETEWLNYGGDKLWPAPQERWAWPPDPVLDHGLQTVQVMPDNSLSVSTPASEKTSIRFSRNIALDPHGDTVTISNTMTNTGAQDVEWSIWEVTQVNDPDRMHIGLNRRGHFAGGYYVFGGNEPEEGFFHASRGAGILKRNPRKTCKIGADAPAGVISADEGSMRLTVSLPYVQGAHYPDSGCGQEIYTNNDPNKYVELELLSPLKTLAPGAAFTVVTHWKLSGKG